MKKLLPLLLLLASLPVPANSVVSVLPRIRAPAARSVPMAAASLLGRWPV